MHHIYTSQSIILKREPLDTSASYIILTRDLGLIRARAQGVRGAKSRLRGALQEFSYSTIAFVHGKAGWKITTAIPERNFFTEAKEERDPTSLTLRGAREIIAHISETLIRLIVGEEKSPVIFSLIEKGFIQLVESKEDVSLIETLILARLLHILGYLAGDRQTSMLFLDYVDFSAEIFSVVSTQKSALIKAINHGFKESQL